MGVVYKAHDTRLDRTVALKFLPGDSLTTGAERARFLREAKAAASLSHPHIATVYEIGESEDGRDFIALEYVEGETLAEKVARGPLPCDEAVAIGRQVAQALHAAHSRGVVHRDVKSSNIMITGDGQVKLMDFGLAKMLAATAVTRDGSTLGTAAYMSPEQVQGEAVDLRTDVWSLGVVLYEMISGRKPFPGDYDQAVLYSTLNVDPVPVTALRTGVPMELERIVDKCLRKDAALRYQHADEVGVDLQALDLSAGGGSGKARSQTLEGAAERVSSADAANVFITGRRSRTMLLGLAAGVAMVAILLWGGQRTQTPTPLTAHLQLILPPGIFLAVDTDHPVLALSPDGTRLVFVAIENGHRRHYLRDLAEPESRAMPGTEGAAAPFFSPDGQWIGFVEGNTLKKVPADGGVPVVAHTMNNIGVNRGATWSTNNEVIVAPSPNSGLVRGSVAGESKRFYKEWISITENGSPHAWPSAIPNGRHVLFTEIRSGRAENTRVSLLSIATGQIKPLVNGGTHPRYTSTGHILFARGASLLAVPFDARRETAGPERKLIDGLMTSANGAAQFAVAERTLAYISGTAAPREDQVVWIDRQGHLETILDNGGTYYDPRLSPDGSRLALVSPDGSNFDVWLLHLGRGTLTRLTSHPGEDIEPVWSPDGRRLALASEIGENEREPGPALSWMVAESQESPELLLHSPGPGNWDFPSSWSPDGQWLAFTAIRDGSDGDVFVLPLDGPRDPVPFVQTSFSEKAAVFSPDGEWIAYVSDDSGREEVYVRPFPGPGARIQVSANGGSEPLWSRAGSEMFYREGERLMAVAVGDGPVLSLSAPNVLFEGRFEKVQWGAGAHNFDVSRDGRRFVMIKRKNLSLHNVIHVVLNWPEAFDFAE